MYSYIDFYFIWIQFYFIFFFIHFILIYLGPDFWKHIFLLVRTSECFECMCECIWFALPNPPVTLNKLKNW